MPDLFNENPAPASAPQGNEPNVPTPTPAYDHLLTSLKNAQGEQKYSSMELAFNGFEAAQQHIAKLEAEATDLRNKATEAKSVEDILAAVQSQGQAVPEVAPVVSTPEIDLDARIADVMAAQASQQLAETNGATVVAKVQEAFGEKAGELYYAKAEALGMNKQAIDSLARTSPEAVFTMLGITGKVASAPAPVGINTESFQHTEQTLTPKGMFGTNAEKKAEWDFIKKETAKQLGL
jgi:hypothetical protein